MTKHILSASDRRCKPSRIPSGDDAPEWVGEEAFAADWTRKCGVCRETPVVNASGLCGPCTFGEADTAGGNW